MYVHEIFIMKSDLLPIFDLIKLCNTVNDKLGLNTIS